MGERKVKGVLIKEAWRICARVCRRVAYEELVSRCNIQEYVLTHVASLAPVGVNAQMSQHQVAQAF